MPESASPREVFARLLGGIADGAWHELPELYADGAVVGSASPPTSAC